MDLIDGCVDIERGCHLFIFEPSYCFLRTQSVLSTETIFCPVAWIDKVKTTHCIGTSERLRFNMVDRGAVMLGNTTTFGVLMIGIVALRLWFRITRRILTWSDFCIVFAIVSIRHLVL